MALENKMAEKSVDHPVTHVRKYGRKKSRISIKIAAYSLQITNPTFSFCRRKRRQHPDSESRPREFTNEAYLGLDELEPHVLMQSSNA